MNEVALYREVGGAQVMRAQLQQLLERCELPNVSCQILPFDAGEHPAGYGSFMVMSFPTSKYQPIAFGDVVYIEYGLGALYLEEPSDIAHFNKIFDGLKGRALTQERSLALIERALAQYE